jgi:catechol 2,3-dioxygenase-like lactoylglutathione lyase family enzyme
MIVALDHTVLVCPDLKAATAQLSLLLGRRPDWKSESGGTGTTLFRVDNTALELIAPIGSGAQSDRLRQILDDAGGPVLTSLVFASDDVAADHRLFGRRGLHPSEVTLTSSKDLQTDAIRNWERFRLADESMAGVKTFVVSQRSETSTQPDVAVDQVHALDHLVVNTALPERAVATYGGRLGLNLALDRTELKWAVRFLFFRVGGLTLEIVHKLNDPPTEQDRLWGMTWAVKDLAAAKSRLDRAGVTTSEIRVGRKPGSDVFTVKSHTLGVPTLFIAHKPRSVVSSV